MSDKSQSISKAEDNIFLVDVETMKSILRNKKDRWNVWIRTFKTQQI